MLCAGFQLLYCSVMAGAADLPIRMTSGVRVVSTHLPDPRAVASTASASLLCVVTMPGTNISMMIIILKAPISMLILHQFESSHFNDKVRWALDFKKIPHNRISYLPGPHIPQIRRRSGGPTTTPLLQHADGFVSGSAAIIDWLEAEHPHPALYPEGEASRTLALGVQSHFDSIVGPATRTAVFSVFIHEPGYLCRTFAASKGPLKRLAYRATLPLAMPLIRKGNLVYPDNIARSIDLCRSTLDQLAEDIAATGYLAGNGFSIADLTAASLLAPLANVSHPDMQRPEPIPESLRTFLAQWQPHPAIQWVHQMYARHRSQ